MTTTVLLSAAAVLAIGVALAFVARLIVSRLLGRLLGDGERSERQRRSAARAAFAFVLVVAVAVALGVLAPQLFADIPSRVVSYLPKVLVAVILLWLGAVLANVVEQLVASSLQRVGVPNVTPLAKVAYWVVLGLAIMLAADQLGVQTAALQRLLLVVLVVAGAATALAVGFGGRALAGTVIAGRYVEERFSAGERIAVGDYEGTITDIGLASTALDLGRGETVEIPHAYLLERPVRRLGADGGTARTPADERGRGRAPATGDDGRVS